MSENNIVRLGKFCLDCTRYHKMNQVCPHKNILCDTLKDAALQVCRLQSDRKYVNPSVTIVDWDELPLRNYILLNLTQVDAVIKFVNIPSDNKVIHFNVYKQRREHQSKIEIQAKGKGPIITNDYQAFFLDYVKNAEDVLYATENMNDFGSFDVHVENKKLHATIVVKSERGYAGWH